VNDQDVAFASRRIKGTCETGGLEHDIRLRHLYTRDCTYVWPQYAVCATAVRYRNTNRGCSRARRLYGVASRIAYSLLNIPGLVVGEHPRSLGTREIYFSRERNFKAAFRGHRLPRQIAFQSVSRSQQRSLRYLRERRCTHRSFNANVTKCTKFQACFEYNLMSCIVANWSTVHFASWKAILFKGSCVIILTTNVF